MSIDDLDDSAFSWPSAGVPLFTADTPRSWQRAILRQGRGSWYLYAASFRFAADALVERFCASGHDQDLLAYPIVFMYRHHVELSLKALWLDLARVAGDRAEATTPRHSLTELWKACRLVYERVWPDDTIDLDAVEGMVDELARVDPTSQVFRYPVDSRGRSHLPREAETFDLLHFAEEMTKLSHWFDGVDGMLDAHTEYQHEMRDTEREMEAEYRAEMAAEAGYW